MQLFPVAQQAIKALVKARCMASAIYRNCCHWIFASKLATNGELSHAAVRTVPAGRFSLYGVRHIAELPLVVTCKRACVTPIVNSYCIGFSKSSVCHAAVRTAPAGRFSLYGVRHISELLPLDICKQACISNIINSTAWQTINISSVIACRLVWRGSFCRRWGF